MGVIAENARCSPMRDADRPGDLALSLMQHATCTLSPITKELYYCAKVSSTRCAKRAKIRANASACGLHASSAETNAS